MTGALGFLGRSVVAGLVDAGHEVVALDNGWRGTGELPAGVDARAADVRDAEAVREACDGCELVVHLAAIQGTKNFYELPDLVLDVNLRGTLAVAEACATVGVRRLVFSSSSECYGDAPRVFPTPEDEPLVVPDPLNPRWSYGGSKIAGELIVANAARRHGFEFTVLRYHNVYGPAMGWDHVIPEFIRRLERGERFTVQGDGEQRRSFCYVDDAVACTLAAGLDPAGANEVFNVGNPDEERSIAELVALLAEVTGREIVPEHVPFAGGGTRRRVPDVAKARELLGYEPRVTLREGLERTYRWYADALAAETSEVTR